MSDGGWGGKLQDVRWLKGPWRKGRVMRTTGDELRMEVQSGVGGHDLAEKKMSEQRFKEVGRTGCGYF